MGFLRVAGNILSLVRAGFELYQRFQLREEARREVLAKVIINEKRVHDETAEIVGRPYDPDYLDRRLSDGSF